VDRNPEGVGLSPSGSVLDFDASLENSFADNKNRWKVPLRFLSIPSSSSELSGLTRSARQKVFRPPDT
jgi:hypothetical protein